MEDFDWTAPITLDRRLLDAACSLEFIGKHEHVLLVGPAGVGKNFQAQADLSGRRIGFPRRRGDRPSTELFDPKALVAPPGLRGNQLPVLSPSGSVRSIPALAGIAF